jgi:hypothetical protein
VATQAETETSINDERLKSERSVRMLVTNDAGVSGIPGTVDD